MNTVLALLPSSHSTSQSIHGWRLDADGSVEKETALLDALDTYKGMQCVLVAPASALSWPKVGLPAGLKLHGNKRLLPVLQGLVEESLLQDAETMHLALPPHAAAPDIFSVAACSRDWLAQWLQAFEKAGIKVARVIPEFAPDVLGDALWATGVGHDIWLAGMQGAVPVALPLDGAVHVFTDAKRIKALPSTYEAVCRAFGADRVELLTEQAWAQEQLKSHWNLAQHGFAGNWAERMRRTATAAAQAFFYAPQWRAARLACITAAFAGAVLLNVQAWRQQQALQALSESIAKTAQQTFPRLQVLVDAPLQMQRELQRLRRERGVLDTTDFEPLASAAGAALHALNVQVSAVQFGRGSLVLEGVSSTHFAAMKERLADSGYVVEMDGKLMRIKGGL